MRCGSTAWCPAAAALDAGRCQRAAAERGIQRAARADDCPRASRSAPRPAETTYLIDATGLRLDARSLGWARFSEGVCGAQLDVIYDPDADRPIDAAITPARVNAIAAAQVMPIEPSATYVFDLGYYDYAGGPTSMLRNAASAPGSNPTRR